MKVCAIQIPFAEDPRQAPESVDFLIRELEKCDESCDLILTPEYSNAPGAFQPDALIPFAQEHTGKLLRAASETAVRCKAIVAVNGVFEYEKGVFRNTTRVFDPAGNVAGNYYKQHLTDAEKRCHLDCSYTRKFRETEIIEISGIRLGFLVCYDSYFAEDAALLAGKVDVVLISSYQRQERQDVLTFLNQNIAFTCNAFVLRSSVGMGASSVCGGNSMVVGPDGRILAVAGNTNGTLSCEIGDIRRKYMRSNTYGGALISNDLYIERGRTPWQSRPAGSMTIPREKDLPYPRVCAHRGFSKAAPENTMAAFGAAVALGAAEIELDVRFSKDGVPVVIHDDFLERVSNGTGVVQDFTLKELKQLDFGSHFGSSFAGTRICTFEEVLSRFARQVVINLHIKSVDKTYPEAYFLKLLALLKKYDMTRHVYLMATPEVFACSIQHAPEIPRCMSCDAGAWEIVDNAIACQCSKVQFLHSCYDPEMIAKAKAHGMICNLFYCDEPDDIPRLLDLGIDTILTNDYHLVAEAVRKYIENKGK